MKKGTTPEMELCILDVAMHKRAVFACNVAS